MLVYPVPFYVRVIAVVLLGTTGMPLAVWGQSAPVVPGSIPGVLPVVGVPPTPTVGEQLRTAVYNTEKLPTAEKKKLTALSTQQIVDQIATGQAPAALLANKAVRPFMAVGGEAGGPIAADPGVALLLARDEGQSTKKPFCTGTLVSPDQILTAAHCVCKMWVTNGQIDGSRNFDLCMNGDPQVGRGPSPLLQEDRWAVFFQHGGLFEVKEIRVDPEFTWPTLGGDIRGDVALLTLQNAVPWIGTAPVPTQRADDSPMQVLGVGFGFYQTAGPTPQVAALPSQVAAPASQATTATSIATAAISPGLKTDALMQTTTCEGTLPSVVCINFNNTATSAAICPGDSGGPAWGSTELVAVASGSQVDSCNGLANSTSLETRLSYQGTANWLKGNINNTPNPKPLWPPFARTGLIGVYDSRNGTAFLADGSYIAPPVKIDRTGILLATINSKVPLSMFGIRNVQTRQLACDGRVDYGETAYVNWCAIKIMNLGQQYQIVAKALNPGDVSPDTISLQFVIMILPTDTPVNIPSNG